MKIYHFSNVIAVGSYDEIHLLDTLLITQKYIKRMIVLYMTIITFNILVVSQNCQIDFQCDLMNLI